MKPTAELIAKRFEAAYRFNQQINLYDQVEVNENFFIGNQWEGVKANGLPTPIFNFLKQVVLFQVATISSDNMALNASALPSSVPLSTKEIERISGILVDQFAIIMERERMVTKIREMLRNAAVDGDGCIYYWFDPNAETGQPVKGEIKAEVIENTRVHFGNPNCRDPQKQPYIMISRRELVDDARQLAKDYHEAGQNDIEDPESIVADSEKFQNKYDSYTDDKVTVVTYFYKNRETGTIWCAEATENFILRDGYDTGLHLYPLVWLSWDSIHDCYHGQAMITGLIPNQKFVNKIFAMVGISLLTTAFPKIIYDKNRIRKWDGSVGTAIGVNGSVDDVAKTVDGSAVNPQIAQFMELCIDKTRAFLGASDVAMGDSRPDNTSAIIALQRAANTPMELTKQNQYQAIEDSGRIWMDMFAVKYGTRMVEVKLSIDKPGAQPLGMNLSEQKGMVEFDFSQLSKLRFAIKLDPGASSYWSEMASQQTLDNMLMNHLITPIQYIERLPNGFISKREELIEELKAQMPSPTGGTMTSPESKSIPVSGGPGNGALQRAINKEGA